MNTVILIDNALDLSSMKEYENIDDICAFLKEQFFEFPKTAKIYHNQVAQNADVTPYDVPTIERLQKLTGKFYIIVYPEGIETILIIVSIAIAVAAVGLSFLLRPHASPNVNNQQDSSPNNQLSARENKARPNERIPDIFGKVWSTPDLLAVPYNIFIAGVDTEFAYYCIGRGSYTVDQVRDDITPLAQITGASAEVYAPFDSPNSGATPQLRIGAAIGTTVKNVRASTSVNGQTILAPNLAGSGFIGPFIMGDANTTEIWLNFVAESGAYQIAAATGIQTAVSVTIEVGITPVDASGTATGAEVLTTVTLTGSATLKSQVGVTATLVVATPGLQKVRVHRTSNTTIAANTSVSDEVKWRDGYAVSPTGLTNFGNVTTVQTLTLPTPDALALKARKLNLLVTRNILIGTLAAGVVTFGSMLNPSRDAADIISFMCQDPRIGNRTAAEIDFVGIYTAVAAVATYFGTGLCKEFCFTFDDAKVSFEESLADVATTIFCNAFRQGSLLSIFFEQQTPNSLLLFNHRNKIPGSETRTVTFGLPQDIDGLEYTYVEPNDPTAPNTDTIKTLTFPPSMFHIHSTGGSTLFKYFIGLGIDTLGVNYVSQVTIQNTGLATVRVTNNHGGIVDIASGISKTVQFAYVGTGAAAIQLVFNSLNVGDELNFNVLNPYIANAADGINLIPFAQIDFTGANWGVGTGATVTVTTVQASSINPKQITAVGVRNNVQAYEQAYRLYNKLLFQNTLVEFQSTQEAATLGLNNRILVADNTRPDTIDGDVQNQAGLLLTLSQPIPFVGGRTYTIFLQHYDGSVESQGITQPNPTNPYQVLLAGAPTLPCITDSNLGVRTGYIIVNDLPQRAQAFLLAEKTSQNSYVYNLKANNYDDRYYFNDGDFLKGFVVSNGQEGFSGPLTAPGATYRPTAFNDIGPTSTTGLTISAGLVSGFYVSAILGHHSPPFSDDIPADDEHGDCIWNAFAGVALSGPTTLHVVVSGTTSVNGTVFLKLNGTNVVLAGAGTYTVVIPTGTYLATVTVEAIATGNHSGTGGSSSITITDIFIS